MTPEQVPSGVPVPVPVAAPVPVHVWARPDGRRTLQLVLGTIWLLDGLLQLQAYFFTKAFGTQFIPMVAQGNPSLIQRPIDWSGANIAHHAVLVNSIFALVQVAIGLGIAWRPTLRIALGASIVWALGIWWVGEGLGGVLAGTADPVTGAPGAVILYALLAVLLWPVDRPGPPFPFIAARAVGPPTARALWLVLWGSLSYFAALGVNRSPQGLHDLIEGMATGEPAWMARLDRHASDLVAHRGLAVAVVLAVLLALVAVGAYFPPAAADATLVVAMVLAMAFWVVGQNFGSLFTNGGTDLNAGPLLVLLAVAYWRLPRGPNVAVDADVERAPAGV